MQKHADSKPKTSEEIGSMVKKLNAKDYLRILNTIDTLIFVQEASESREEREGELTEEKE